MDRLLILAAAAALFGLVVLTARGLALRGTSRARALPAAQVWSALGAEPDGRPAVALFTSPSCAECATQRSVLPGVRVLEVDAAAQPEVAARFGVLTAPSTAVLGPEGSVRALNHGFAPADRLAAQLGELRLRSGGRNNPGSFTAKRCSSAYDRSQCHRAPGASRGLGDRREFPRENPQRAGPCRVARYWRSHSLVPKCAQPRFHVYLRAADHSSG